MQIHSLTKVLFVFFGNYTNRDVVEMLHIKPDLSCLCLVARARCSSSMMQLGGSAPR